MTKSFYPNINSIINIDSLPDHFNLFKAELNRVFDSVYFKNYQVNKTQNNDEINIKLELILLNNFEIPITENGFWFIDSKF